MHQATHMRTSTLTRKHCPSTLCYSRTPAGGNHVLQNMEQNMRDISIQRRDSLTPAANPHR